MSILIFPKDDHGSDVRPEVDDVVYPSTTNDAEKPALYS